MNIHEQSLFPRMEACWLDLAKDSTSVGNDESTEAALAPLPKNQGPQIWPPSVYPLLTFGQPATTSSVTHQDKICYLAWSAGRFRPLTT